MSNFRLIDTYTKSLDVFKEINTKPYVPGDSSNPPPSNPDYTQDLSCLHNISYATRKDESYSSEKSVEFMLTEILRFIYILI